MQASAVRTAPNRNNSGQGEELRAIRTRELNLKRNQGAIACAECRRLKLKCDRKVPCLTCKRRGCENICPTGVSARVREPRRRLRAPRDARPQPKEHESTSQANTASVRVHSKTSWLNLLVSKLTAMSDRIRTLEDALQQEYSIHQTLRRLLNSRASSFDFEIDDNYLEADRINTKEKLKEAEVYPDDSVPAPSHPLLSLELLEIKNGIEAYVTYPDENDGFNIATGHEDSTSEMIDAFGVLTIRDGHRVGFSGASAPEDNLLLAISDEEVDESQDVSAPSQNELNLISLPTEVIQANSLWPFPPLSLPSPTLAAELVMRLPSRDRAITLTEAYFASFAWICTPLERSQAFNELIPLFYPSAAHDSTTLSLDVVAREHPQELALLFAVLGCGVSAISSLATEDREAKLYADLSRASFSLCSFLEDASLTACQALSLLDAFKARVHERPTGFVLHLTNIALVLACTIGLNRDPERLTLTSEIKQRRRRLFWEIYAADLWRCLNSGRQPAFTSNSIDAKFPKFPFEFVGDDGKLIMSVQEWRYRFARDILSHVAEKMTSVHPVKYSEILELDRKIRAFGPHPFAVHPFPEKYANWKPSYYSMQPRGTAWYIESLLLFMHRNFFARAMLDFPEDPLSSVFAPSVLACYSSACCLLRLYRRAHKAQIPRLNRIWYIWASCISCSVILATIAAKGHVLDIAMPAFHELELSMEMCEQVSNPVVKHGLVFLRKLRDKAYDALFGNLNTDGAARSISPLQPESTQAGKKAADPKSNSRIVSSKLFQDTIMAKFIASDQKSNESEDAAPVANVVSQVGYDNLPQGIASTWDGASDTLAVQMQDASQAAPHLPPNYTDTGSHPTTYPDILSNPSLFTSTSLDWNAISQPMSTSYGGNFDTSIPISNPTFSASASSSAVADSSHAFDYNYGANTDVDMNTTLGGCTDWLDFMQIAGAYDPEANANAGMNHVPNYSTEWPGYGFS